MANPYFGGRQTLAWFCVQQISSYIDHYAKRYKSFKKSKTANYVLTARLNKSYAIAHKALAKGKQGHGFWKK